MVTACFSLLCVLLLKNSFSPNNYKCITWSFFLSDYHLYLILTRRVVLAFKGSYCGAIISAQFFTFVKKHTGISAGDPQEGSRRKLRGWNRALIIGADVKPKSCVFIVIRPPGIVLNWNIPICFCLCASASNWVKIRTGLSDSEALAWFPTVSQLSSVTFTCWNLIRPYFQLSCDDVHKHTAMFQCDILYLLVVFTSGRGQIFPSWIFIS